MQLLLFFKGLAVGFAIAAPVGPVGILCIQRSLTKGVLYGLASGMGAACADAVFGAIAAFGVSFIAEFLARELFWFQLGGASLLLALGCHGLLSKGRPPGAALEASDLANDLATTFLLTITNPITIFSLTAVFAAVGIATGTETFSGGGLVTGGVFLGSALWWLVLTSGVNLFRGAVSDGGLPWVRRVSGVIMLLFGAGVLVHIFT
ncbi:MAG TPA: LysE family transporter [Alphaproteobacteria bacterium]|nr:LysE family transporter [Alphaproteobacteria bacterium]